MPVKSKLFSYVLTLGLIFFGNTNPYPAQDFEEFDIATVHIKLGKAMWGAKKQLATIQINKKNRNVHSGYCGIEYHGNSTLLVAKNSYEIELRTSTGTETPSSILGMPIEEDFILLANYFDRSFMRNVLAFKLWEKLGHWAPKYRFVRLYLDDQFKGLYMLTERIKGDRNRMTLRDDPIPAEGFNTSAPFIFELNKEDGFYGGYFSGINRNYVRYRFTYPSEKRLKAGYWHVQQDISKVDAALWSIVAKKDTATGKKTTYEVINQLNRSWNHVKVDNDTLDYKKMLDMESFADYFIVQELSKNPDGFKTSALMHRAESSIANKSGKLKAGPVWDFDLAFSNVDFDGFDDYTGWAYNTQGPKSQFNRMPSWWHLLLCNDDFKAKIKERLIKLNEIFSFEDVGYFLDDYNYNLANAIIEDEAKWNTTDTNELGFLRPKNGQATEHMSKVYMFYKMRYRWMLKNIDQIECADLVKMNLDALSDSTVIPNSNGIFSISIP